ncbi:hypothetical protein POTOM_061672 [Populus tomentosa]|uniref:Uncharacterized protein n=1 Tax=Populus tomentosa TaxID=118781 RepID=A0A8X7XSR4_POPTO|nr:hypothetical protein POTOM_061672 [Populus tomentosa]
MELMKTFIPYVITIINGKMNISSIGDNHNDGVSQSDALYSNKEDETEFNYDPNGEKGPAQRGRIHPEWGSCSHGSMQSPIDLMNDGVDKPANSSHRNRGHDMMLKWEGGAGIIEINGSGYMDSSSAAGIHLLNIQSMAKEVFNSLICQLPLEARMVDASLDRKGCCCWYYVHDRRTRLFPVICLELQGPAATAKMQKHGSLPK